MRLFTLLPDDDEFERVRLAQRRAELPYPSAPLDERAWPEPRVVVNPGRRAELSIFEFAYFACRKSTQTAIERAFPGQLTWLDLGSHQDEWVGATPRARLDVVDPTRSEILRFDDGAFMSVQQYEFKPGAVPTGIDIFRAPPDWTEIFVTEAFTKFAQSAGLRGIEFRFRGVS